MSVIIVKSQEISIVANIYSRWYWCRSMYFTMCIWGDRRGWIKHVFSFHRCCCLFWNSHFYSVSSIFFFYNISHISVFSRINLNILNVSSPTSLIYLFIINNNRKQIFFIFLFCFLFFAHVIVFLSLSPYLFMLCFNFKSISNSLRYFLFHLLRNRKKITFFLRSLLSTICLEMKISWVWRYFM